MVAGALAPCIAKTSAPVILTRQQKEILVLLEEGFNVMSMWKNDMKCKYMFLFQLKNFACKGLTHYTAINS